MQILQALICDVCMFFIVLRMNQGRRRMSSSYRETSKLNMPLEVQSEVQVQSYSFSNSARCWGECSTPRPNRLLLEKGTRYPVLQTDGWPPGSIWTGVEKRTSLRATEFLTPKDSFRSESITRKQESFYLVGYSHRPTKLDVVSRH